MHAGFNSYKPSRCVRLLLQLLPVDGNLTGLRSVTLTSLWHAVKTQIWHQQRMRKSPSGGDNKDRKSSPGPTYQTTSTNLICSCCEVHGCTFIVITSVSLSHAYAMLSVTFRWHALTVMRMHLLHVVTHAHATAPCTFDNCTRSGSPHNVLHSSSIISFRSAVAACYCISADAK